MRTLVESSTRIIEEQVSLLQAKINQSNPSMHCRTSTTSDTIDPTANRVAYLSVVRSDTLVPSNYRKISLTASHTQRLDPSPASSSRGTDDDAIKSTDVNVGKRNQATTSIDLAASSATLNDFAEKEQSTKRSRKDAFTYTPSGLRPSVAYLHKAPSLP